MDTGALTLVAILVVVTVFLLYAIYYSFRGKKKPIPPPPEPKAATVESPKVEAIQVANEPQPMVEKTEAQPLEPPKQAEPPAVVAAEPPAIVTAEPPMEAAPPEQPADTVSPGSTEAVTAPESSPPEEIKTEQPRSKAGTGEGKASTRRPRGVKIIQIEGIGQEYAEKLSALKITTTNDLLSSGATPKGRRELSVKMGASPKLILEWVNLADLFRIKGIGEEYSDLLEEAGVDTVVELSNRNAARLHARILEVNEAKKLVRRPPSLTAVERWIQESKTLPRIVEY